MRPEGWHQTKLGHIATVLRGVTYQKAESSKVQVDGLVPVLRANNIAGQIVLDELVFVPPYRIKEEQFVRRGDIVVAMSSGSSALVGKAAEARCDLRMGFGAFCGLVRVHPQFARGYVGYFLQSDEYRRHIANQANGININNLRPSDLEDVNVWLAPLGEQERIVAKIEELFSQLDAGVANLKQARALVGRYRQSVLKAAVSGELTAAWCERRPGGESGKELLTRILKERRRRWEEAHPNRRYAEPAPPNTDGLPELPERWVWATLPQLGEFGRGKSKHRPRNDPMLYGGAYPFIQTGIVRESAGTIRRYEQTYSDAGLKQSKLWPVGTVCITIAANIAETGILAIDACFPDSIVGFVAAEGVSARWVELFVRTAKDDLNRYAPATAQKNINLDILGEVAVPLPPLAEQAAIVEAVETAFSDLDAVEAAVAAELARAGRQRQAILAAAFSGKLVPQDPADEPAEKLLERLSAMREDAEPRTRKRKTA